MPFRPICAAFPIIGATGGA